jgi:hypothetical protein
MPESLAAQRFSAKFSQIPETITQRAIAGIFALLNI